MKVLEMYYTVGETALLVRLCTKTVLQKLRAGEFGDAVVNLGSAERPDYRLPASGVNAWLERCRVFTEPGIAARTEGELRRKAPTQRAA